MRRLIARTSCTRLYERQAGLWPQAALSGNTFGYTFSVNIHILCTQFMYVFNKYLCVLWIVNVTDSVNKSTVGCTEIRCTVDVLQSGLLRCINSVVQMVASLLLYLPLHTQCCPQSYFQFA